MAKNLAFLEQNGWLKLDENRVLVTFPPPPAEGPQWCTEDAGEGGDSARAGSVERSHSLAQGRTKKEWDTNSFQERRRLVAKEKVMRWGQKRRSSAN